MHDFIEELTGRLLDSFERADGLHPVDATVLPSKKAVGEVTQRLLHLLFPGFYDDDPLRSGLTVEEVLNQQFAELTNLLISELKKSLEESLPPGSDLDAATRDTVRLFLGNLPTIRQLLTNDIEAAYDGDPAATSYKEIILAYPGLEAIAIQRLAHTLHGMGIQLVPRMMTEWAHSRTGIDIHPGAKIGSHFFIDHGTGVVIGETTEIGDRVKIYHGVTLGARSTADVQNLRGKKRHPTICDNVTIYPGATLLGGETVVGKNSTIGGNVFLISRSVPADHIVLTEEQATIMRPKKEAGNVLDFQI